MTLTVTLLWWQTDRSFSFIQMEKVENKRIFYGRSAIEILLGSMDKFSSQLNGKCN